MQGMNVISMQRSHRITVAFIIIVMLAIIYVTFSRYACLIIIVIIV